MLAESWLYNLFGGGDLRGGAGEESDLWRRRRPALGLLCLWSAKGQRGRKATRSKWLAPPPLGDDDDGRGKEEGPAPGPTNQPTDPNRGRGGGITGLISPRGTGGVQLQLQAYDLT